jgi:hypothetical protein
MGLLLEGDDGGKGFFGVECGAISASRKSNPYESTARSMERVCGKDPLCIRSGSSSRRDDVNIETPNFNLLVKYLEERVKEVNCLRKRENL